MARVRVVLNSAGMAALLNDYGVDAELGRRAEAILSAQKSACPVETGHLQSSLQVQAHTTDRVTRRVGSFSLPYGMLVEARTGFISRSVDAAGGA
jgi:hypothetical protein